MHSAFTRSLQAYVTSVKAFAITGKGAEEPSRQVAKELYELTNVWQKTIDEHGKWVSPYKASLSEKYPVFSPSTSRRSTLL